MVADAITISDTPLILLDEVENAGIFKDRVIETLKEYNKALIFVTHDPMVSLMSDRRIVMKNGGVSDVLEPNGREEEALLRVIELDRALCRMREQIRAGEMICSQGSP